MAEAFRRFDDGAGDFNKTAPGDVLLDGHTVRLGKASYVYTGHLKIDRANGEVLSLDGELSFDRGERDCRILRFKGDPPYVRRGQEAVHIATTENGRRFQTSGGAVWQTPDGRLLLE